MENISETDSDSDDGFCPALPPHLLNKSKTIVNEDDTNTSSVRPPTSNKSSRSNIIGPMLPPTSYNSASPVISNTLEDNDDEYCPEVPSRDNDDEYCPEVPSHDERSGDKSDSVESGDSEEDIIGPIMPTTEEESELYMRRELEYQKQRNDEKLSKEEKDKQTVRETWMLELPSDKPNLIAMGLTSRSFRTKKLESGDRTVWTDLPSDIKLKKEKSTKKEAAEDDRESSTFRDRDKKMAEIVDKFTTEKRKVALIEMHQQKKSKSGEGSVSGERRPFTREDDLSVTKFDDAQKANILKGSLKLNDRFSAGKGKYL